MMQTIVVRSVGLFLARALAMAMAWSVPAHAADYVALIRDTLQKEAAAAWPKAVIDVDVLLDPRLRLQPCAAPQVILRGQQRHGRVHVALRCGHPAAWSVYIPANIRVEAPVLVASRPIARGEVLSASAVRTQVRALDRTSAAMLPAGGQIEGLVAKRPIPEGTLLTLPLFGAAPAVKAGDTVTVQAGRGAVRIETLGKVKKDGRIGEQVTVANLNSGREVRAWVVAAGQVSTQPVTFQ